MKPSFPNRNAWWGHLVAEELARLGVRDVFATPGSRSTPLVLAFAARSDLRLTMHVDERGVAFAALGAARATGRPAVVLTTSGTAAANLLPAIVEAAQDGVPMIVLTADRPAELRDCGANQAIDQVKLFGSYVRWFAELPSPQEPVPAAAVLTAIDQAHHRATAAPAGPVHLNIPLREPLAPSAEPLDWAALARGVEAWLAGDTPYTSYASASSSALPPPHLVRALKRVRRGVIVAGELRREEERTAVLALARAWGWPVLADIRSGLRGQPGVLSHADLILLAPALRPDAVVQFGARLVSKRVQEWIFASRAKVIAVVSPDPARIDPGHGVTHRVVAGLAAAGRGLAASIRPPRNTAWRHSWQQAEAKVVRVLTRALGPQSEWSEAAVAREVARPAARQGVLVLASSMAVRHAEIYATRAPAAVLANRGASGIDGTVATALGAARAAGGPVTLLLGDLALLHDLNSMALVRGLRTPFVAVVLNNDGGGIFHLLPVADFPSHFEACFATPHGRSFAGAAKMFGWRYAAPASAAAFRGALAAARARRGPTLIEVRCDRAATARWHRGVLARIAAALDAAR